MLSLDVITLGVPEIEAARSFYTATFGPVVTDAGRAVELDMQGAGRVSLMDTEGLTGETGVSPSGSGFRGYIVSYVVEQPAEVRALVEAAVQEGATVLKPPKGGFFGGYSAAIQTPDGSIWKLSSGSKKDTAPAADPPRPSEVAALLGVSEPKASKAFYTALGMAVDRDYGNKYIDFRVAPGACRLGLMPRQDVAKDVGVGKEGSGFSNIALVYRAPSTGEVDAMLSSAAAAGGKVARPAAKREDGAYAGHFTDPDGYLWKVETAAR